MRTRRSGRLIEAPEEARTASADRAAHAPTPAAVHLDAPPTGAGVAQLQRTVGNRAVTGLLKAGSASPVIRRKEFYAYGGANTVPHIHNYNSGCHIKINDPERPGEPVRIDLVKAGKRNYDNVAYAFRLARATGNMTLVNAIKASIAGTD